MPDDAPIAGNVSTTRQHCAHTGVRRMTVRRLREYGNDGPGFELKRLRLEVAEGDGLVVIGVVDPLERANALRGVRMVVECVWNRTKVLTMYGAYR